MIGLELQTKGLNLRFQVFFLINIFYNDMIDHHRRGCIFLQPIFVSKDMQWRRTHMRQHLIQ